MKFHFDTFMIVFVPVFYILCIPGMYISMFLQRKSYYSGFKKAIEQIQKEHFIVPEEFKTFKTIPGLTKLGPKFANFTKNGSSEDSVLKHSKGEVWLIDYWASHVPTSKKLLSEYVKLQERNKQWGTKVKIIPISINSKIELALDFINQNSLQSLDHYHVEGPVPTAMYKVKEIPHIMIVDKEGQIVYKGHPLYR